MSNVSLDDLCLDIKIKLIQAFGVLEFEQQHYSSTQGIWDYVQKLPCEKKEALSNYLKAVDWPRDHLFALNLYLFDVFADAEFIDRAVSCLNDSTCQSVFSEALWGISRRRFLSNCTTVSSSSAERLRSLFNTFSASLRESLLSAFSKPKYRTSPKTLAIISPQMLSMGHSPTREAYSIALHLKQLYGCQVTIINTNGMNYREDFGVASTISNHRKDWPSHTLHKQKVSYLQFKDEVIDVVSLPATPSHTNKLIDMLTILEQLQVDAVIAHGENTFYQDLLFGHYPSVFCTTGSALPFARCDAYFVPSTEFNADVLSIAKRWGHGDQFIPGSMFFTPQGHAEYAYPRSEFGLTDKHFVYLVVGLRLDKEVDDDFANICNNLLDANSDAVICFAGTPDLELSDWFEQQSRCLNIGFQSDLAAICQMSDVYLNPKRQGGGTSSQTALVNGLPVVTLDYGHISSVVPEKYRFSDWDEYLRFAQRLGTDRAFYQAEAQSFQSHLHTALGIEPQIRAVYAELSKACQKYFDRAAAEAQAIPETTLSV